MSSCADGFSFKCEGDPNQYPDWRLMTWEEASPFGIVLPNDLNEIGWWYELIFQLDRLTVSTYKQHVDIYYGNDLKQQEYVSFKYDSLGEADFFYRKIYNQEIFIISEDWDRKILPHPITNFGLIRTPICEYMFTQGYYIGYCYESWNQSELSPKKAFNIAFDLRRKIPYYFSKQAKVRHEKSTIKRRYGKRVH